MFNYINGVFSKEFINYDFAKFSWNSGFFTTLKVVNGQIIDLDMHLARLERSLKYIGLPLPELDFNELIERLLNLNNLNSARLKIMVYKSNIVNCYIQVNPLKIDNKPRRIAIFPEPRISNKKFQYKSINYSENINLNMQAKLLGWDDYLFFDEEDRILETTFCNIFFISDSEIVTPLASLDLLPGTIRNKILALGEINNFKIYAKELLLADLPNFKAVFLTNAIIDLVQVQKIGKFNYKDDEVIDAIKELV